MAGVKVVWAKVVTWLKSLSRRSGSRRKETPEEAPGASPVSEKAASNWWGVVRSRLRELGKAASTLGATCGRVIRRDLPRRLRELSELYRKKVPSRNARLAIGGVGAVAVLAVATLLLWPDSDSALAKQPGKEYCEFLARPAAKLFIDGELVAEEIPPIHRVQLDAGKHHIRFVSPDSRTHETEIEVVEGKPARWLMNFVENRLHRWVATAEEATK